MRERGHAIPAEDWWLRLARSLIVNDPRDLRTLGKDLAKHLKRRAPFNHTHLSRFASGNVDPTTGRITPATLELAQALCIEFTRLPRPFFIPRSYEEAVHMQAVSERYESSVKTVVEPPPPILPLPDARRRRKRTPAASPIALSQPAKRRVRGG